MTDYEQQIFDVLFCQIVESCQEMSYAGETDNAIEQVTESLVAQCEAKHPGFEAYFDRVTGADQ